MEGRPLREAVITGGCCVGDGCGGSDNLEFVNLWPFFSQACFNGFGDGSEVRSPALGTQPWMVNDVVELLWRLLAGLQHHN